MAEPKRYFWLKLHKDFFKRKDEDDRQAAHTAQKHRADSSVQV